ncbi:uncharacterized protein B0T23DRAFT_58515 [Neurospora hispaniola]|uniref:Uncharacterized protein n=1 Tax=Neurospora hispaniola TaxID=588809 RepID=A0AAJ0HXU4_9PEZI|nr:hypothetical protein B0T23DRAFT_58515 [Neurospora hispaniola]
MHIVSELLGHLLLCLSFWLYLLSFYEWFPYLILCRQSRRSRFQCRIHLGVPPTYLISSRMSVWLLLFLVFLVMNFSSHHATAEDSADGRTDERTNNDTHEFGPARLAWLGMD